MTAQEQRDQEATAVSVAYQVALAQVGVATIEEALQLWDTVPVSAKPAQGAAWLAKAVHLITTRRSRSRELAMAYYRLVRALRTGRTIADPAKPNPPYVTLATLRREFAALAGSTGTDLVPVSEAPVADTEPADPATQYDPPDDDEDERIPVEKLDSLATEQARLEREAEDEAHENLEMLGLFNLDAKVSAIDTTKPAEQVDAEREDAHSRVGTRQAAAAERIVMNGARAQVWATSEKDSRVLGYARVSLTGTPCGFCAMLISRGAVYKTAKGAQYSDGDAYHDNCHCIAEPLYSEEQFADDRFDLNREYGQLWQDEIARKYSGKDAVNAWRRLLRAKSKASALAARSTQHALEATPSERQPDQPRERDHVRVR